MKGKCCESLEKKVAGLSIFAILFFHSWGAIAQDSNLVLRPRQTYSAYSQGSEQREISKKAIKESIEQNLGYDINQDYPSHRNWLDFLCSEGAYVLEAIKLLGTGDHKTQPRPISGEGLHKVCDVIRSLKDVQRARFKGIATKVDETFPEYAGVYPDCNDTCQIEYIKDLTEAPGNIKWAIEILSRTGYQLSCENKEKLSARDCKIIKKLACARRDRYEPTIDIFEKEFGYPGAKNDIQVRMIIELTEIAGIAYMSRITRLAKDYKKIYGNLSGKDGLISYDDFKKMGNKLMHGYFEP